MKKVITIVAVVIVVISMASCRASRGYGCPDTYNRVGYNFK